MVFKYPLDRSKNFVKRVVGVGPEDIRVLQGDLWHRPNDSMPWEILRRPRNIQTETWKRLDREEPETTNWFPEQSGLNWDCELRSIDARGPGRARFGPESSIMDNFLHGYPDPLIDLVKRKPGTGVHPVGDVRVDGTVEVGEETEYVGVVFYEGARQYRFNIPGPAAPANARPTIEETMKSRFDDVTGHKAHEAEVEFRLEAGRRYDFGAQNLDDLAELEVDGEILMSIVVPNATDQRSYCFVHLEGGAGATASFSDLMAYRDIYYTGGDLSEYEIPAGHYFMLGDNTQDSSDSREWKFARLEPELRSDDTEGKIIVGNSRRDDDPWQKNPWRSGYSEENGPLIRFRDMYGEVWWFEGPGIPYADPSTENSPYVPRRLIQGRALSVFWPLSPRLGLYRWKWIH